MQTRPHWSGEEPVSRGVAPTPPRDCEVAVVGAGYTGLATALALSRAGVHVHIFDKGERSEAASSRNAGFCTISPPVPVAGLLSRDAQAARQIVRWYEAAVDAVEALAGSLAAWGDVGFRRTGNLRLAETLLQAERLERSAEAFATCGAHRVLVPGADLDLPGPHRFRAGLRDGRSAVLNPGRLHRALESACLANGVGISRGASVETVAPRPGGVSLSGAGFAAQARRVVVATNGSAGRTLRPFSDFLAPVGSFILVTEPFPEGVDLGCLARGVSASTTFRFPHYFRIVSDRRLLFGGRANLSRQADPHATARWLRGRAQALFPGIAIPAPAHCWGGVLGFSADKLPLLGRLDEARFYGMGCSGHGVPTSIAMARDLAAAVEASLAGRTAAATTLAPFWREPSAAPTRRMRLVEPLLPLLGAAFRGLDGVDRARDLLAPARAPLALEREAR